MRRETVHSWDRLSEEYAHWREVELDLDRVSPADSQCPERCRVAVDAGCGPGIHAAALAARGAALVVAFDVSWGMLQQARKRKSRIGATNLALVAADAEAPPLRPGCTDFVISINALNGTDLDRSLPALSALLAPSGRLVVQFLVARMPVIGPIFALPTAYSLRAIPAIAKRHGVAAAWRVARFVLSPSWVRTAKAFRPNLAAVIRAVAELMPGAQLHAVGQRFVTISWSAPA